MGVDLHFIGSGISSGGSHNGFGKIVSFPVASGFPAFGTFISYENNIPYPAANGGAQVSVVNNGTTYYYPSQIADFQVQADGAGGSYINFGTATNVEFEGAGINFAQFNTAALYLDINPNCNDTVNVQAGFETIVFYWDGIGSYYSAAGNDNWFTTSIYSEACPWTDEEGNSGTNYYDYVGNGSGGVNVNQS